ncbi:hypothetical protein BH10PLA2_BH10PLA2_09010 [soil metagenome]
MGCAPAKETTQASLGGSGTHRTLTSGSVFSIGVSRKQGTNIACPKCGQPMTVPKTNDALANSKQEDWWTNPPTTRSSNPEMDVGNCNFEDDPDDEVLSVLPVEEPAPPPPINHPGEFVRIQKSRKGRTFPYRCYGCDTVIELRQRVTQSKRVCPGCGKAITIEGIDSQVETLTPQRSAVSYDPNAGCATLLLSIAAMLAVGMIVAFGFTGTHGSREAASVLVRINYVFARHRNVDRTKLVQDANCAFVLFENLRQTPICLQCLIKVGPSKGNAGLKYPIHHFVPLHDAWGDDLARLPVDLNASDEVGSDEKTFWSPGMPSDI